MEHKPSSEDVLVWADGTWCYRCELHEMNHMSDDYEVFYLDTPDWHSLHGIGG